jgi:hypothetical protein
MALPTDTLLHPTTAFPTQHVWLLGDTAVDGIDARA